MATRFNECGLASGENDSDDHQHGANRTTHRESLDDRAERADVGDDDGRDDLPGHDETDRIADAEPPVRITAGVVRARTDMRQRHDRAAVLDPPEAETLRRH